MQTMGRLLSYLKRVLCTFEPLQGVNSTVTKHIQSFTCIFLELCFHRRLHHVPGSLVMAVGVHHIV